MRSSTVRKGKRNFVYSNPAIERQETGRIKYIRKRKKQNLINYINNSEGKDREIVYKIVFALVSVFLIFAIPFVGFIGFAKKNEHKTTEYNAAISALMEENTVKERKYSDYSAYSKVNDKAVAMNMTEAQKRENIKIKM